jgi:hypothetical protein
MRETERFAAAAIAFGWMHHGAIRNHFFGKICRFPGDPPLSSKVTISIEPEEWADLFIVNSTHRGRFVYVIECKIAAALKKHQNPAKSAFGRLGGYGRRFIESENRKGTKCRFVLFRLPDPIKLRKKPWNLPLEIQQRTWKQFAEGFPVIPLARDLALCLGKLGVGDFPASETKTMKVDTKRTDIGNAVRTLAEIQRRLEWPGGHGSSADFYQEETRWFLGVELKHSKKSPNSVVLRQLVKAPAQPQAWLGEEGEEGEEGEKKTKLSLYVYCANIPDQSRIARKLRSSLRRRSKDFQITEEEREKRYFNVAVRTSANSLENDAHWFETVFKSLGLDLIP